LTGSVAARKNSQSEFVSWNNLQSKFSASCHVE